MWVDISNLWIDICEETRVHLYLLCNILSQSLILCCTNIEVYQVNGHRRNRQIRLRVRSTSPISEGACLLTPFANFRRTLSIDTFTTSEGTCLSTPSINFRRNLSIDTFTNVRRNLSIDTFDQLQKELVYRHRSLSIDTGACLSTPLPTSEGACLLTPLTYFRRSLSIDTFTY